MSVKPRKSTGDKIYKCSYCEFTSNWKNIITSHQKTQHENKMKEIDKLHKIIEENNKIIEENNKKIEEIKKEKDELIKQIEIKEKQKKGKQTLK